MSKLKCFNLIIPILILVVFLVSNVSGYYNDLNSEKNFIKVRYRNWDKDTKKVYLYIVYGKKL